jgi:hypothetical protein
LPIHQFPREIDSQEQTKTAKPTHERLTVEDIEPLRLELRVLTHGVPLAEQIMYDILDVLFEFEYVFLTGPPSTLPSR